MYRIFTKELRPQEIFNVNLTKQEVEENNIDIWIDHKELDPEDYIVVYNQNFDYPILKNGVIEEMTRDEKVANDIEVTLFNGEIIKDKKIVVIPCPSNLYQPKWNGKEWEEGANKIDLLTERKNLILKYKKLKDEIATLKEMAELDEELASPETIKMLENEIIEVKNQIKELTKIIKSLEK